MPGIVVFKRRWSVGSDDLVLPAGILVLLHVTWITVLSVVLGVVDFDVTSSECAYRMWEHVLGYLVLLSVCALLESCIVWLSMQGSILDTHPRGNMQYLLYARLGVLVIEIAWLIFGVILLAKHYHTCEAETAKKVILGIIVFNWLILLSVVLSLWCTFDSAGRSWVKMKRYQESVREHTREPRHVGQKRRQSGSRRRNWRQRKAMRAYEQSWDRRCNFLFCCVKEDRHKSSFSEVAKLFTEFFRDLDVVPSDIVAGFALLRKHQKLRRKIIVSQGTNEVYQYLSGVAITPTTNFVRLTDSDVLCEYKRVIHYMRYALAAYGWPMYMMLNTGTGLCKILPHLRCCCLPCGGKHSNTMIEDNCCECNIAALRKLSGMNEMDLVYVTYHVDIGETPFYVAVDHEQRAVVVSVRGTLSLQDVLTDLKADAEQLPVTPPIEEWLGHKGMVQSAVYIKSVLIEKSLLGQAFNRDVERGTPGYDLVLVGHSLGAGTAAILAILLKQEYPHLRCYAYSPPGGLLSKAAAEATKDYITSVVVGKDVVSRIGLHQLEATRQDLINIIKHSNMSKWRIIGSGMFCCGNENFESSDMMKIYKAMKHDKETRNFHHPNDSQIALTQHNPLYPPGKIIHIVRNHPKGSGALCNREKPVYQAIWANTTDFDEVLISPTMVQDHMPDKVFEAIQKVLVNVGPAKPSRKLTETERRALLSETGSSAPDTTQDQETPQPPVRRYIETSFSTEDEHNVSSVVSDENSLTWDYTSTAHGHPQHIEKQHVAPVHASAPSPHCHRHVKQKRNFKLDFAGTENWSVVPAPLATPETLSDTSSYESLPHGNRRSGAYQKLIVGMPTMEPIQQSPMRHLKSEGYNYFIQAPSPVDYADSPEREYTEIRSIIRNNPAAAAAQQQAEAAHASGKPSTITTEATVEMHKTPDTVSNLSNDILPESDVTAVDVTSNDITADITSGDISVDGDVNMASPVMRPCSMQGITSKEHSQCSLNTAGKDVDSSVADDTCRAYQPSRIVSDNKNEHVDHCKAFDVNAANDSAALNDSYVKHSPETPDSYVNQIGYDLQGSHYSPAGRGYPHGAYMAVEIPDPGLKMTPMSSPVERHSVRDEFYNDTPGNDYVSAALLNSTELTRKSSLKAASAGSNSTSPTRKLNGECVSDGLLSQQNGSYKSYRISSDDNFITEETPILEESLV